MYAPLRFLLRRDGHKSISNKINDPAELEFAVHLQESFIAYVAEYNSGAYVGLWNAFVLWRETLMRPS